MVNVLLVGFGGMVGSVLRYLLSSIALGSSRLLGIPFGTLSVNIIGAFLLGLILGLSDTKVMGNPEMRLFLATGILGGFTTFSAFGGETLLLIRDGDLLAAALNVVFHIVIGIGAVWVGLRFAGG